MKDQSHIPLNMKKNLIKIFSSSRYTFKELDKTKYSKDIIKHLLQLNIEKVKSFVQLSTKVERYDYAIQISKSFI